mgnify:FL=1
MNDCIVVCCWSIRLCQDFAYHFCQENCEKIKRVLKRYPIEIVMDNGNHILVMTYKTYGTWCLGRTYKHYGEDEVIYHSGYAFKREEGANHE